MKCIKTSRIKKHHFEVGAQCTIKCVEFFMMVLYTEHSYLWSFIQMTIRVLSNVKITTWTKHLQITPISTKWNYEFVNFELDKSKNCYYIQCTWWILNLLKQIPSRLCIYNSAKFIRVVISRQILDYALSRIIYTYTLKIILVCWSCTKLMWFWERLKQILE